MTWNEVKELLATLAAIPVFVALLRLWVVRWTNGEAGRRTAFRIRHGAWPEDVSGEDVDR